MIDHLLLTYQRNLEYAQKLVADVPDGKMTIQPAQGTTMNHAAWLIGHLATTSTFVAGLLGAKAAVPAEWEKLFGYGSKPASDPNEYPAKAELLRALEASHGTVAAAVRKLPTARWSDPFPMAEMRSFVPTLGDGVVFLLTTHEGMHLGQLSAWRRAQGLPSVM
jgi:hypothetical protein